MNIEEAEALHVELLQNLPGTGDATSALSAVVELHSPIRDGRHGACKVCMQWNEERAPWPCGTVATINQWAHVNAIMTAWQEHLDY